MNMQPKGNFEVDEDLELPLPVVSTDEEEASGIEELFSRARMSAASFNPIMTPLSASPDLPRVS